MKVSELKFRGKLDLHATTLVSRPESADPNTKEETSRDLRIPAVNDFRVLLFGNVKILPDMFAFSFMAISIRKCQVYSFIHSVSYLSVFQPN